MSITIAFNTANLVAHYSGYQFKLNDWMTQHAQVVDRTDFGEWEAICEKIHACGYDAIEVWVALIEKCLDDEVRAEQFLRTMQKNDLTPVALAGALNEVNARLCRRFGIPAACGGFNSASKPTVARLMRETGILANFENHPEKSADAIRQAVDHGANGLAVALDTGWLATQHVDSPKAVRELGRLIRHVHLKDVAAMGAHDTVKLGDGVVDIPGVITELKAIGYTGVISWEDEPENRNPFDIAAEMREYIRAQWAK